MPGRTDRHLARVWQSPLDGRRRFHTGVSVVPTKTLKQALGALSMAAMAALWSTPAAAAWTLNLREGVTELSREIYGLHMLILWICVVIGVAVFGVMIYSIATFRKSKGAVPGRLRPQHQGRDHLDRHPGGDPGGDGGAGGAHADQDRGRPRRRDDGQGHRLPVEVAVRIPRRGRRVLLHARSQASNEARQLGSGVDPNGVENYLLDVDNPLVVPGRHQGARAGDRGRTSSTPGGCPTSA